MIFPLIPSSWQELQRQVCQILQQVGIAAQTDKLVATPRGTIRVDVYGIDEKSIDKIRYIVECKHWNSKVPQKEIHAFTAVMHETGGHIGYFISNRGFQKGALKYIGNTNISALTYKAFQEKYCRTLV